MTKPYFSHKTPKMADIGPEYEQKDFRFYCFYKIHYEITRTEEIKNFFFFFMVNSFAELRLCSTKYP